MIQNNFPLIKSQIDLERVAAALGGVEGMLTTDQLNLLWQRFTPEEERKSQLLEFVCQRGDERRDPLLDLSEREWTRGSGQSAPDTV